MEGSDIVRANDRVIQLLRLGSYIEAIDLLDSALHKLICHFEGGRRPSQSNHCCFGNCFDTDGVGGTSADVNLKMVGIDCHKGEGTDLYNNPAEHRGFLVSSRAVALFGEAASDERQLLSVRNEHRVVAAVLYNTAMTYHAMAIQTADRQEQLYLKALEHYKSAIEILVRVPHLAIADHMLCMAMINNIGHIYSQLFETTKAEWCLDQLQTMLEDSILDEFEEATAEQDAAGCGHYCVPGDGIGDLLLDLRLTILLNQHGKLAAAPAA